MKISIIVTSHKGTEPYLQECLDSIMAQTEEPHEIILVIDGYTKPMLYDGTTTIIRDQNIGVALSRDEGVKLMTGTHILFVDGDDVLPENFLYEMRTMMQWKKVDIVYPSCVLWSKWGDEAPLPNSHFMPALRVTKKEMLKYNQIVVSSLMKKKVYTEVGGFDPDIHIFEDWDFFLKAMFKGFKVYRANTFLKYRQRTTSRNHMNEEHKQRITDKIRAAFK